MKRQLLALATAFLTLAPLVAQAQLTPGNQGLSLNPTLTPAPASFKQDLAAAGPAVAALTQKDAATLAQINGTAISQSAFDALLLRIYGRRAFQEVAVETLVNAELAKRNIPTDPVSTQKRLANETQNLLQAIAPPAPDLMQEATRRARLAGGSQVELQLWLNNNAGLSLFDGTPATVGLSRDPLSESWIDRTFAAATVIISDPALAAQFPKDAPAVPGQPKITLAPTPPGNKPALASVNGTEINPAPFATFLRQAHAIDLFPDVLDLILAQQERAAGAATDEKALHAIVLEEFQRAPAMTVTPNVAQPAGPLSPTVTPPNPFHYRIKYEALADLRPLAGANIAVPQDEIDQAYQSQYGERRQIHVIQLAADDWTAKNSISMFNSQLRQGYSPEQTAHIMNLPAPAAWVVSRNAKNIDEILKVAFNLLKKPGDMSGIMSFTPGPGQPKTNLLILLDRIEPDRTVQNPLTDALRHELSAKIAQAKENEWIYSKLAQLRAQANVRINDPDLAKQFAAIAAQAAQTTQPMK